MTILLTILFSVLAWSLPAHATYYWADSAGSNTATCANIDSTDVSTDPGSYGTISAAARCALVAGDVILVKAGTYTGTNHKIKVDDATLCPGGACFVSGTSETVMTGIMAAPGATVNINIAEWFTTYDGSASTTRNYFFIKNLNINAGGGGGTGGAIIFLAGHHILVENNDISNPANAHIGAFADPSATRIHHITIRNNRLHGQATDGNGNAAYLNGTDNIFEYNEVYDFKGQYYIQLFDSNPGRRGDRAIIRYNYFHDIHVSTDPGHGGCGGVAVDGIDSLVYRNVIVGDAACTNGIAGLGSDGGVAKLFAYHNLVTGWGGVAVSYGLFGQTTGNIVKNNHLVGNGSNTITNESANGSTVTASNNRLGGTITDCTAGTTTYTQKSGSSCIDQGVAISGFGFNGSAPDIGPFETFGFSSATINANNLDVTLGMNVNTPVLPASGQTTWTTNNSRTITAASKLTGTDSVVRLTVSGAVCAAESWTVTYAVGTVTDSAAIGGASWANLNQPMFAFSGSAVTNNCGSAPPSDPGTPYIYYKFDENTGTSVNDETVNNLDGTLTNGPTWTTGKTGSAVLYADSATEMYTAIPYGSGVNPSTQSLTVCLGVLPTSTSPSQKIVFSADNGADQRMYIGWIGGTWGIGIQASGFTTGSEFPLVAEWTRLCLVMNSGTDVATLYVNGVAGTSAQVVKSYTSYTFASNFKVGVGTFSVNYGGSASDDLKIYQSALSASNITDDYQIWSQSTPAPTGTFEQKTHKGQRLRKTAGGSAEDYAVAGVTNGATLSVMPTGALAIVVQIDCTVANCDPTGFRLRYRKNGTGSYIEVPNVCGSDGICFYGTPDNDIVSGTVTCCLTGVLTANDGPTNTTADAVPLWDGALNSSFVRRSVLKFNASPGDYFELQEWHQTSLPMNTYTPSGGARINIGDYAAGF